MLILQAFRWDFTVSVETIIGIIVWVSSFVVFLTIGREDIKALKAWMQEHKHSAEQRDIEIQQLVRITDKLAVLSEQFAVRLDRIEANCDRRHVERD